MKKITNLNDLFIQQLRELYNAENLALKTFPQLKNKASSTELKNAIQDHMDETEQHVRRLEKIFDELDSNPTGEKSTAMQGLINEGLDVIERCADPEVRDAALIATIQYIEHFEIAGYGSACTYADELGLQDIADQLYLTLTEEKETDEKLSDIAMEQINEKAKVPVLA